MKKKFAMKAKVKEVFLSQQKEIFVRDITEEERFHFVCRDFET